MTQSPTKERGEKKSNKTEHIRSYKKNPYFTTTLLNHEMFRSLTFQRKGKMDELHGKHFSLKGKQLKEDAKSERIKKKYIDDKSCLVSYKNKKDKLNYS